MRTGSQCAWSHRRRLNDSTGQHGFLFRDGVLVNIDYPGASSTVAFGINNSRDITAQYPGGREQELDLGKTEPFITSIFQLP